MSRKLVLALLGALGLVTIAQAALMGTLVSSQMGSSVTGRLVWECTYTVGGSYTTVTLEHMCPPTMMFN